MFTGIIEEIGTIAAIEVSEATASARITVHAPNVATACRTGDSVALDGACLTITDLDPGRGTYAVDVMRESLERTTIGRRRAGERVNLERALAANGRLDGHIVQGHVDGVATLLDREHSERWDVLTFALPARLARYVAEKGSITVDGTSLTVTAVRDAEPGSEVVGGSPVEERASFSVSLIPLTLERTVLGSRQVGDEVNVEVDILAKYVERLSGGGSR